MSSLQGQKGLDQSVYWNQGCQFRTVPAGTAEIFLAGAWTGIETRLIRTVLNTGVFWLVSAISADSSAFRAVSSFRTGTN